MLIIVSTFVSSKWVHENRKTYTNEFNEYKTITANAIKLSICKWFPDKSARAAMVDTITKLYLSLAVVLISQSNY